MNSIDRHCWKSILVGCECKTNHWRIINWLNKSIKIHKNKLAFEIYLGLLLGLFDSVEMWVLGANHIVCVDIHN